jgi:putative Holliday junction resolvase
MNCHGHRPVSPRTVMYHRTMERFEPENGARPGRILAIDYGSVRIGLAVSDALGLTAQGLPTLERTNKRADISRIAELAADYSVAEVIVGNPVGRQGQETEISRRAARFGDELRTELGLLVVLWDERLTSLEADRALAESGATRSVRRRSRDRMAAQILLQSYLDRRAYQRAAARAEP